MPSEFEAIRRVEFSDTDLAGIMHYSNYFRFMETAEHAFFRSLGYSVVLARSGHRLCLPRVHAACEYQAPLFFEDEVRIQLLVEKKSPRSLAYQFRFFRLNGDPVKEIARGRLVVVCAERREDGSLHPATLPSALAGQIQVASPEILASPLRPAKPKPQLAA